MSASDETDDDRETPETAQAAIDHIDARARTLRDEQLEQTLAKIDEQGTLTPKKRVVIAALADRLTSRLIEPPKSSLTAAAEREDETTVTVALDLFSD